MISLQMLTFIKHHQSKVINIYILLYQGIHQKLGCYYQDVMSIKYIIVIFFSPVGIYTNRNIEQIAFDSDEPILNILCSETGVN